MSPEDESDRPFHWGSDKTESTAEPSQTEASLVCESVTW